MKNRILSQLPNDFPWNVTCYDTIPSTNDLAKTMAAQGAPHGTVLIAQAQTGGRGRMGRSFHSPSGQGIYLSVILRPKCSPSQLMHLTCSAAVAMCDAVEQVAGFRPGIKWTNDLVYESRKLGGILTELSLQPGTGMIDFAIVGIGINCTQELSQLPGDIASFAGSLAMFSPHTIDRAQVAAAMVSALKVMDDTLITGKRAMLDRYRADCVTLGKDISLLRGEEVRHAHALDVDEEGGLIVRLPDGNLETVCSGEVSVRGMYGYLP